MILVGKNIINEQLIKCVQEESNGTVEIVYTDGSNSIHKGITAKEIADAIKTDSFQV